MDLKKKIRNIPDFPKKGIIFRDITTLLKDKKALRHCTKCFVTEFKDKKIDYIAATESRGFIFGSLLAHELECGFIPIRKLGKLPAKTIKEEYELEYGRDVLEIHHDAVSRDDRVLIIDDLLATGGTGLASARLVEKLGGELVALAFLIELEFLEGRKKLGKREIFSLIKYDK